MILKSKIFVFSSSPKLVSRTMIPKNNMVTHGNYQHGSDPEYDRKRLKIGSVIAIAHPKTIQRIQIYKEPWTINGVANFAFAPPILGENIKEYEKKLTSLITKERHKIYQIMQKIEGIEILKSLMESAEDRNLK